MIRRPPRSTQSRSSAASDVYKRQPRDDVLGRAVREDETLEERVGREPVRAVNAGARRLARRVQAGQAGPPVQIRHDTAGVVVLRRRHRDELLGEVDPVLEEALVDGREPAAQEVRSELAGVEEDVVGPGPRQSWTIARETMSRGASSA